MAPLLRSLAAIAICLSFAPAASSLESRVVWQDWSDARFETARKEKKFVLLYLEAVWCHWCHVMDRETYGDPAVAALIERNFVPVKVDQDARPDLGRRYEDYGWPATIVFAADGSEIVKRRGFIAPDRMRSLLQAIVDDPAPINYRDRATISNYAKSPLLTEEFRVELRKRWRDTHDDKVGGLRQEQKFLDADTIELALDAARRGDAAATAMARLTLDQALALHDPVWGGVYQYSTHGDWRHPHFEKIMSFQADAIRLYAQAFAQFGDARYLAAARSVADYLDKFLSAADGEFFVSQDADLRKGEHSAEYFALADSARRKLGVPAIDRHIYARENGWAIEALATLYAASGDTRHLSRAQRAAERMLATRLRSDGGFRHDGKDAGGPYLDDSLSMGRALLALHAVTGERRWLDHARRAADFIDRQLRASDRPGYVTSPPLGPLKSEPHFDQNIGVARLSNLLHHYTGDARYRWMAEHAMRLVATRELALWRRTAPGLLLADGELGSAPTHLAIVGPKDDGKAEELFRAALAFPASYRRVEWWDRREGPLAHADVDYPVLQRSAAFVCTDGACSLPLYEPARLAQAAKRVDN